SLHDALPSCRFRIRTIPVRAQKKKGRLLRERQHSRGAGGVRYQLDARCPKHTPKIVTVFRGTNICLSCATNRFSLCHEKRRNTRKIEESFLHIFAVPATPPHLQVLHVVQIENNRTRQVFHFEEGDHRSHTVDENKIGLRLESARDNLPNLRPG